MRGYIIMVCTLTGCKIKHRQEEAVKTRKSPQSTTFCGLFVGFIELRERPTPYTLQTV